MALDQGRRGPDGYGLRKPKIALRLRLIDGASPARLGSMNLRLLDLAQTLACATRVGPTRGIVMLDPGMRGPAGYRLRKPELALGLALR